MIGEVTLDLWQTATSETGSLRVAQLAFLENELRAADRLTLLEELKPFLDFVSTIKAATLFAPSTAFFWYALRRLRMTMIAQSSREEIRLVQNSFKTAAFDAFFKAAPGGFRLVLYSASDLVLPCLGIKCGGPIVGLQKLTESKLLIERDTDTVLIDTSDIPAANRLRMALICDGPSQVLFEPKHLLFDDRYNSLLCATVDEAAALTFPNTIAKALNFIKEVDFDKYVELTTYIRWYGLVSCDIPDVHRSFSVRGLTGVIFLSSPGGNGFPDWLVLSQAIIHEAAHNELNLFQEAHQLCIDLDDEVYYSPWRPDPRPLWGLIHAIFVFSKIGRFLAKVLQSGAGRVERREIELELSRTLSRVKLGVDQVPITKLTPLGNEILKSIRRSISQVEDQFPASRIESEPVLRDHLLQWFHANPQLRHVVRSPFS